MDESIAPPATGVVPVAVGRWPASLRGRFALWFGLLVVAAAVTIRLAHYRATADLLARDLDVQLWARLGTLVAQERFAPETLLDPRFHVGELFMPDPRGASGWTAAHAVGIVVPYAGRPDLYPGDGPDRGRGRQGAHCRLLHGGVRAGP